MALDQGSRVLGFDSRSAGVKTLVALNPHRLCAPSNNVNQVERKLVLWEWLQLQKIVLHLLLVLEKAYCYNIMI